MLFLEAGSAIWILAVHEPPSRVPWLRCRAHQNRPKTSRPFPVTVRFQLVLEGCSFG